jgi:hypothetical protein
MLERLGVGVAMYVLQQTAGINPVFNFGGIIYESVLDNEHHVLLYVVLSVCIKKSEGKKCRKCD